MANFRLVIVTQQETVFDDRVDALTLPGSGGYFGILANHAPIVAVLDKGNITIRRGSNEEVVTSSGGFIEMSKNEATLLLEDIQGLEALSGAKVGDA